MSVYDRSFYQLNKDISNTQQLVDEYRYRPQLFDDDQVDELENRANELKIPFERKNNKTSLLKVAGKFADGFQRGLIPFIPPLTNKNRPQTTYESIAYSLGHLAGFAPGLLYLPLRGVTTAMRGASFVKGLARGAKPYISVDKPGLIRSVDSSRKQIKQSKAYGDFLKEQEKISRFEKRGKQVVNFLDQMSIPMKVSRAAKRGVRTASLKINKGIPYDVTSKKTQSIIEEAIGLGAASTISNVWAGPDEYMNTFLGGALAGGAFGTIGNYVSIGNRLKFAKTPQQRDMAEKTLRGLIGASFTGLPSTLRDEPIEEQLYQYLLGGFFGYSTRPAAEKEGGLAIMRMPTDKKSIILQPERLPEWSSLDKPVKDYIHKRSTEQAKEYLRRKPGLIQNQTPEENAVIRLGPALQKGEKITPEKIDKVIRDTAHDAYNNSMDNTSGFENYDEPIPDNLPDAKADFMDSESFNTNTFSDIAGDIYKNNKMQGNPGELANKIEDMFTNTIYDKKDLLDYQQDVPQLPLHKLKRSDSPSIETFIQGVKQEIPSLTRSQENKLRQVFYDKASSLTNSSLGLDISDPEGTIVNINPGRREEQRKIIDLGAPGYNNPVVEGYGNVRVKNAIKPLTYLIEPSSDGFGKVHNPISDIFAVDYDGALLYPDALLNLNKQLAIKDMYLRGGVKDKKIMTAATFVENNIRLFDQPNSTEVGLLSTSNGFTGTEVSKLKEQFKNAVIQAPSVVNFKNNDVYLENVFVSNIIYEMEHNGYGANPETGLYNGKQLKELMFGQQVGVDKNGQPIYKDNFLKNAVDFNKREQSSMEASGVPLNADSFDKDTITYAVINDSILGYYGSKNPESIDGSEILSSKLLKQINTAIGREPTAKIKTNTVGTLVNAGGRVYQKTASYQPSNAMDVLMEELGVDKIITITGNKFTGEHKVTKVEFNNETGKYDVLTEQPHTYKTEVKNMRVNPSVRENVAKDTKGQNLPVQIFKTADITFTPKTLDGSADYYFKQPPIQKALEAEGDVNKIKKDLQKDNKNLNKYSLDFILPKLQDPNPEYDYIRQAFQGIMKDEQSLLNEDFTNLSDPRFSFFHSRNQELIRYNNGMAGPLLINNILKSEFANAISRYIVMRAQNPFWESATKGFASPSEHGVIKEADFALKADRDKYKDASNRLMLLDKDAGKVKVTIKNLNTEQIASLNKGIRGANVKKLNKYDETNLATIHNLTKEYLDPSRIQTRDQKIVDEIQEARKLLAIRVPSDAVSGTRALIFAGFTNQSGLGFHVSNLDYRAMGGMDNDSDTGFLIFNPMPDHWTELNKPEVVNFVENINQEKRLDDLNFIESTATGLNKFDLKGRIDAYKNGQIGAANRGRAIALRDVLNELVFKARNNKEGNYYVANLNVIDGIATKIWEFNEPIDFKTIKLKIPVKEFEARKQEALEIIFTYINGMNDSTKYIIVPEYNFVKIKIYQVLFDGLKLDDNGNLSFDVISYVKRDDIIRIGERLFEDEFQLIKKVSTEFKLKPYKQEARTLKARKKLYDIVENVGPSGVRQEGPREKPFEWSGPIGKMLKNYKPNLLQLDIKDFNYNLNTGLQKALEPYKDDPNTQSFLEVFLKTGAGKVPIKEFPDTYKKLENKIDKKSIAYQIGEYDSQLDRAFESDLEVTVNKVAAHELLNKYAVEAFQSLPERKKPNVIQFQNQLNTLWNRARSILSNYHYTFNKISTNNNAPGRVDYVDIEIKTASQDILKFAKDNNLDKNGVRSLKLFFDTALLTPFKVKTFFKIDGVFWGSTEVSPLAKANFLKEINNIVQQSPIRTIEEITNEAADVANIKLFEKLDIFRLPKATNINDMVENQKHLDTETTVDANDVVIKNVINKLIQPDELPMQVKPSKIISGGQVGVDTAFLIISKDNNIETGGTAPPKFLRQDKKTPEERKNFLEKYNLKEGEEDPSRFIKRTKKNVDDSDATIVFNTKTTVTSGTAKTIGYAQEGQWIARTTSKDDGYKPVLVIRDLKNREQAIQDIKLFFIRNNLEGKIINGAGPRALSPSQYEDIKFILNNVFGTTPTKSKKSTDLVKYTPDLGKTKLKLVETIPTKRDKPIGARYNKKTDTITISEPMISKKFEEKAWTESATLKDRTKATPLPKDIFKTEQEFYNFVILHELAHKKIKKRDDENLGEYEDRVNKEALSELSKLSDKPKSADIKEPKVKSEEPKAKSIKERNAEQFADLQERFNNSKDMKEIKKLRDNLNKYNLGDADNSFMEFTYHTETIPRDLTTITMDDIKAWNNHFDNEMKKGLNAEVQGSNWFMKMSDTGKQMSFALIPRFKRMLSVKTKEGLRDKEIIFYMDPINTMLEFHRNLTILKDFAITGEEVFQKNELDYTDFMSIRERNTLTELISNIRNTDEKRLDLTLPEYNNFLTKIFSNTKGMKKTGEQWLEFYNNKYTEMFEKISKDYIHAWNSDKTELLDMKKILEVDLPKNILEGKRTIVYKGYLEFDKNGNFDFKLYEKGLNTIPGKRKEGGVAFNINNLLLYQYYKLLPLQQQRIEEGKQSRIIPFSETVEIGIIDFKTYYPRLDYAATTKDKRLFDESVLRLFEKKLGRKLDFNNPKDRDIFAVQKLKIEMSREDSRLDTAGHEVHFVDSIVEGTGFNSKTPNLRERNPEFPVDGYSKRFDVISRYINGIITSRTNNIYAVLAHKEIENFINNPNIKKYTKEYKEVDSVYKDNIEVWSDYLYIHLKNTLGHPSFFTQKVMASLDKGDPLKLKTKFGRLYYNTSDAFAVSELLKLRKKYIDKGTLDSKPILSLTKDMTEKQAALFLQRTLKDFSNLEARWQLMTILFNTGSGITNIFGNSINVIGQAGFVHFRDAFRNSVIVEKLLTDEFGNFVLTRKNGSLVTSRKDLVAKIIEDGVVESYMLSSEMQNNEKIKFALDNAGVNIRDFTADVLKAMKSDNENTVIDVIKNYGVYEAMTEIGAYFMQKSEQISRVNSFLAFTLKGVSLYGNSGRKTNLADPFIFQLGLRGIESTSFLYVNSRRPPFMTSSLGKMFTRFKLFVFESVRTRQQIYRLAKYYGFKPGTKSYKNFVDYLMVDLFVMMLAGAYMYSIFDTALSPPYNWFKETAGWLFGDKKERDRAFYGTFPRPIAPMQELMPPMSRVPGAFVELLRGDWDKFADYTIWTLFPGGRMGYSIKKSINSKDWEKGAIENFTRLPIKKVQDSIKLEKTLEDKKLLIDSLYEV